MSITRAAGLKALLNFLDAPASRGTTARSRHRYPRKPSLARQRSIAYLGFMPRVLPNTFYHFYSRGNNQQKIFFKPANYQYFENKVRRHLSPHTYIIAYCLMPNHFHFLLYTKSDFNEKNFTDAIRTTLSSYTRAIHKQEKITGSLFQQNSKKKEVLNDFYAEVCFHYIHQNPVMSRLTKKMEEWTHSSFNEYWKAKPGICDIAIGQHLIPFADFYERSYYALERTKAKKLMP